MKFVLVQPHEGGFQYCRYVGRKKRHTGWVDEALTPAEVEEFRREGL